MPRTPSASRPVSYVMRDSMPDLPEGNIVYQSLQRPKLLRGAEWQYSMINNLVAGFLVLFAITGWNWHLLLAAAILGGPVQWLLRMLSRHDPQFFAVYFRSQRHPLIRHPN
jgi:type IV secretory pathway TrbD component